MEKQKKIIIPNLEFLEEGGYKNVDPPEVHVGDGELTIGENGLATYFTGQDFAKNGVTLSYSQWSAGAGHPLGGDRADIMAGVEQKSGLIVSNPGGDLDSRRLYSNEIHDLSRGELRYISKTQWDAVEESLGRQGLAFSDIRHLHGMSLGSTMLGSAIAAAPSDVKPDRVDLWETAGMKPDQSVAQFMLEYIKHGGDDFKKWVSNNPEWAKSGTKENVSFYLGKMAINRLSGLAMYPVAIKRSAPIEEQLRVAKKNKTISSDTHITVLNGSKSEISRTEDNERLCRDLARVGLNGLHYEAMGATHASQDNLGWWLDTVSAVNRGYREK